MIMINEYDINYTYSFTLDVIETESISETCKIPVLPIKLNIILAKKKKNLHELQQQVPLPFHVTTSSQ